MATGSKLLATEAPDPSRQACAQAKRIVINVDSALLPRSSTGQLSLATIGSLVDQVGVLLAAGRQVALLTTQPSPTAEASPALPDAAQHVLAAAGLSAVPMDASADAAKVDAALAQGGTVPVVVLSGDGGKGPTDVVQRAAEMAKGLGSQLLVVVGGPAAGGVGADAQLAVVVAPGLQADTLLKIASGQREGVLLGAAAEPAPAAAPAPAGPTTSAESMAKAARAASRQLQAAPSEVRERILLDVADTLEANAAEIDRVNQLDVEEWDGKIGQQLLNRLRIKPEKVKRLAEGIRSIARQEEPIRKMLRHTRVAQGLDLQEVTTPIGVLLIIFESRPDALPQIAACAIRSGNGLILKGGKEAARSNELLHRLIAECIGRAAVPPELVGLVKTRDEIDDLLKLDHVIDLVIPRGSNKMVSYIQQSTRIPVLGHADGVCHVYIHTDADQAMAESLCVDSKIDYPAACNAAETILVHSSLLQDGRYDSLVKALQGADIVLHAGPTLAKTKSGLPVATELHHEYSNLGVTIEVVDSLEAAIDHIHTHGSGHTETIVTQSSAVAEDFLRRVDAACVHHNASTRFSDGFRYGLGAEVGISTGRIHARGPVGVDGLLTTKWLLRGHGEVVKKDTVVKYVHQALPLVNDKSVATANGA